MCRRRRRGPKKKAQIAHARKRAYRRFGIDLDAKANAKICDMIQYNQARFVDSQSNRVSRWIVEWKGERFVAVYDKKRKVVVTVLPTTVLEPPTEFPYP